MTIAEAFRKYVGRFDTDLEIEHHFVRGLYAKQMHLAAGHAAISHAHTFDHMSILAKGVAEVRTDAGATVYRAPAVINIVQGVYHQVTAIEDITWFCIHATTETDPARVDEVLVQKEGSPCPGE